MMNAQAASFNSQTTVAELMTNWPQTIHVFLKHKMNCVGCRMSPFDTIEDAAANYAIPVSAFLNELNSSITSQGKSNR